MTTFERSGHYRKTLYSGRVWVSGSTVQRDDFSKSAGYTVQRSPGEERLIGWGCYREGSSDYGPSARLVRPNAKCPVCGAPVYFYQNEYGSRVFFDELGPPWPKHPCTDNAEHSMGRGRSSVSPSYRKDGEINKILGLIEAERLKLGAFRTWMAVKVKREIKVKEGRLLVLVNLLYPQSAPIVIQAKGFPSAVRLGAPLFLRGEKLAYWNLAKMESEVLPVWRAKELHELTRQL
jgi:hypothetical protein